MAQSWAEGLHTSSSSNSNLTAYQLTAAEQWLCSSVGFLSVIGSVCLILSYVLFKSLRSTWRWLLLWLSMFDLAQGAFYVLVAFVDVSGISDGACLVLGLANIATCSASFLCTMCISFLVVDLVSLHPTTDALQLRRMLRLYYSIFIGYPFCVAVIIVILHVTTKGGVVTVDDDQYGCYINHHHEMLRMVSTYIPLFVSWVLTVIFYLRSVMKLKRIHRDHSRSNSSEILRQVMWRLSMVPLVFIMIRLPDAMNRVAELNMPQGRMGWLETTDFGRTVVLIQAAFNPSQGLINGVLFVLCPRRVRRKFYNRCCAPARSQHRINRSSYRFSDTAPSQCQLDSQSLLTSGSHYPHHDDPGETSGSSSTYSRFYGTGAEFSGDAI